MTLKVVGAGFGRTGTKSLKAALEQLGFGPCYHMIELHENLDHMDYWQEAMKTGRTDWDVLFAGYEACVDWPATYYWRELTAFYPDAKVLLSIRSAESWLKSIQATIFPTLQGVSDMPSGILRDRREMTYEIIARRTFEERLGDRDYLIAAFNRHIEDVQNEISSDRLLTYDVAEGWGPLCEFLDVDIPESAFPATNTMAEFQERARERERAAAAADRT